MRAKQLEEKQIEFGKLQFVMKALMTELENLQNEVVNSKKYLENLLAAGGNISVDLIGANNQHIHQRECDIVKQIDKINAHKILLDEKQQEMIEAHKAKSMLEKLKEKQYKTFLKELDLTERKELDEIGIVKYAR